MAEKFIGKWNHVKTENLDEFLKALDVGVVKRTLASVITGPSLDISIDEEDCWTIATHVAMSTTKSVFKIGEHFEDTGPAGNKTMMTASLEDGKLVMQPVDAGTGPSVVREVIGEDLVMTLSKGDVVSTRTFKRA